MTPFEKISQLLKKNMNMNMPASSAGKWIPYLENWVDFFLNIFMLKEKLVLKKPHQVYQNCMIYTLTNCRLGMLPF